MEANVVEPKIEKESTSEIDTLATEITDFLKVDTTNQVQNVGNIIDGILAKLEEYCTVVDLLRAESKEVLFTTIPLLHEQCLQLDPICEKIDSLENFVSVVRESVEDAEEKVRVAEKELGNKNLKKILRTVKVPKFLAKKKEIQPYLKKEIGSDDYHVPKTFKTDDYFKKYDTNNDDSVESAGE